MLIFGVISCVMMPTIQSDGKVSATDTEPVSVWNAGSHAERMMESKGWAKPKANLQDESELWLWVAAINAGLMSLSFVWAYLSHQHDMLGAGVIFGILALFCTGVSAIMTMIAWIVGGTILVALIWAGVKLRKFSLLEWLQHRKDGCQD
jgi:hypothetical protein